jgi:hypothetical protein
VSHTPVSTDFLQSLQVLSKFVIESVGEELRGLSIDNIPLSIKEPFGDFILGGILDDGNNTFEFFRSKLSSSAR